MNYEWLQPMDSNGADVLVAPCDWYLSEVGNPPVYPFPIDREVFKFQQRTVAKKFVFVNGHSPDFDRQGLDILEKAIPLIKSDAEIIVYTQVPIERDLGRAIIREGDFPEQEKFYEAGDVLLFTRRYAGQSLVLNEALSAGMAIIATDMKPQNKVLPKRWLLPVTLSKVRIKTLIEYGTPKPEDLARMIDEMYGSDITELSRISDSIAQKLSWEVWNKKWEGLLCGKTQ
jgi:glycosyltransferase involved in cell wall biosynthesis